MLRFLLLSGLLFGAGCLGGIRLCGDGIIEPGEQCDDGLDNSDARPGACPTNCLLPACGNGVVEAGEVCYSSPQILPAGPVTLFVSVGDVNQDAALDLVVTNGERPGLTVFLGEGDGSFRSAPPSNAGEGLGQGVLTDLNNDGLLDLAAVGNSGVGVLLLGEGDGSFSLFQNLPLPAGARAVVAGDFDKAGQGDLAFRSVDTDEVFVFLSNERGAFFQSQRIPVGGDPGRMLALDLNSDEDLDLITANASSADVSILLGGGGGSLFPLSNTLVFDDPAALAAGDFNRDGVVDLLTVSQFPLDVGSITMLLGAGDGGFDFDRSFTLEKPLTAVTTGDFNADGLLDAATTDGLLGNLDIILGDGEGDFFVRHTLPLHEEPDIFVLTFSVASGDFNADGVPDLVTANDFSDDVSIFLSEP